MAKPRRPKKPTNPKPLTDEQVLNFWEVARTIARTHDAIMDGDIDDDGATALLNQLYYCGIERHEWDTFLMVVKDADDVDFRSPQ